MLTLADLGSGYTADSANTHATTGIPDGKGYQAAFLGTPEQTGTVMVKSAAIVFTSDAAARAGLASGIDSLAAESQAQLQTSPADLGSGARVYSFVGTDGGDWLSVAWLEGRAFLVLGVQYRAMVTDTGPLVAMARIMDRSARQPGGSPNPSGVPNPSDTARPTAPPPPTATAHPSGCFGCVTITDVTVSAYAATPDVLPECLPANVDLGPAGQVIGPNVSDPQRTFPVNLTIRVVGNGSTCGGTYSGTVRFHSNSSGGPMEIVGIAPSDPFPLQAGVTAQVAVTIHVPDGNTYSGPLGLDVYIGGSA